MSCHVVETEVCAVIVTFNPTSELLANIAAIRPQVSRLVIVDNGSGPEGVTLVHECRARFGCETILNGSNLGIAKALNIGIAFAESQECKQTIFFDQDSIVGDRGYVASMLEAYEQSNRTSRVAIVVPRYFDRLSGAELPSAKGRDGLLRSAMTSGTLVPMHIFKSLGLHDETLYMDYVDIEFCLRCRRAGYSTIEAPRAILRHSLGRRTTHSLCGRTFSTTNHDAQRRYYITRNRLLLMCRYWRDRPWSVREMWAFILDFIKIVLVEENKRGKIKNLTLGVVDALKNRAGHRTDI
jgi:rhamnosyltransferase